MRSEGRFMAKLPTSTRFDAREEDRAPKGFTFTVPRLSELLNSTKNPTMRFVGFVTCAAVPSIAFARSDAAAVSIGAVVIAAFVTVLIAARRRVKRDVME